MKMDDTIFALSSGAAPSAIAIIRISGPQAFDAVRSLCGGLPEPRRASLRKVRDAQGSVLDEALLLTFPAPHSATGEDLAELHVHGGRAVVRAIEDALSAIDGLRAATAGEYTRRAFENGVMDLNQADGLSDLLFAETQRQRKAAMQMMSGSFSEKIAIWQDEILTMSALIESELDFSDEDDVDSGQIEILRGKADRLKAQIDALLHAPPLERLRDGLKIVLGGPPNSGKSTLLNRLVGRDAAIVSDIAGTTRDVIEIAVSIGGMAFIFLDTAGVRDNSDDHIEKIGIERAHQAFDAADIILWLGGDAMPPIAPDQKIIPIAAKSDLKNDDRRVDILPDGALTISAKTGDGIDALIETLLHNAKDMIPHEDSFAINQRQRTALSEVSQALNDMHDVDDWLILGENARMARMAFDKLTGRAHTEELLDNLFARFCIGK